MSRARLDPVVPEEPEEPGLLLRATTLFHKLEIAYVIATSAVVTWGILSVTRDMIHFAVLWGVVCLGAAVVALWPRTPRLLHFLAEAVLLIVAIGQLIGPRHDVLPILGHPAREPAHWREIPLTQRRILTWNVMSACFIAWAFPAIAAVAGAFTERRRQRLNGIRSLILLAPVWAGLGLIFYLVVREMLF